MLSHPIIFYHVINFHACAEVGKRVQRSSGVADVLLNQPGDSASVLTVIRRLSDLQRVSNTEWT